jgi:cytoskeletal protein RodZ
MATGTTAYDFGMFEPKRRPEQEPERNNNVIEIPRERLEENRRPKHSVWKMLPTILSFLIIAGMAGTYLYGQVQLAELSDALGTVSKQLSEDQSVYTQMKMKSEAQTSLETVENYASNKLGMEKVNQKQVETITLSNGDKTQVLLPVREDGWFSRVIRSVRRFLS